MKRSKHSLSHYRLLTCDMAELIPVACYDVLPGDSVQQHTSALLRVSPMEAPVMHPITVRVHHWYVPYRLLWTGWEDFITGGSDGLGDGAVFPTISSGGGGFSAGALADYLGIPPSVANLSVSALPFRAYNKIYNEFYRDADLTTERAISTAGGADATTAVTLAKIAWEKDYITSARPWPQKGPAVTLPLGTTATVRTQATELVTGAQEGMKLRGGAAGGLPGSNQIVNWATTGRVFSGGAAAAQSVADLYPTNLYADLSTATAVSVNDVREAFALQRYQEARAIYGSRFTEYLRYLGIRSSDARLQRPEYLGGGKSVVSLSEVLQTGVTTSGNEDGIGNLRGHGIGSMRSRRFRRFFEEHGVVLSLLSVRPRTMYVNNLPRMWSKTTKEDYWQKELELIGQQEVKNKEVYAADSGPNDTFGWQERYAEYRHHPSQVSGEFRTTLNYWHLGRIFAADVTLNNSMVECDPSKRIHQVQTNDVLWVMVNNSIQARRLVRKNAGVGRII